MQKFLIAILATLSPLMLFAHGAGESIQKEHNGYLLSVGTADEFVYAEEAGRINFEIENKEGVAFEGWTGVWTRIMSPSGELLFAGTIERGGDGLIAGMTYFFSDVGVHDVSLRFMSREQVIAESEFLLPVREGRKSEGEVLPQNAIALLGVLTLGVLAGYVVNARFFRK